MTNLNLITLITIVVMTFSGVPQPGSTTSSNETRTAEQVAGTKSDAGKIPPERAFYCEPYPECSIWPEDDPDGPD